MITKNEIKKSLPYGSAVKIAQKAGVSKMAVSKYLNDLTKSSPLIERAALEVALEYQKSIAPLTEELRSITEK